MSGNTFLSAIIFHRDHIAEKNISKTILLHSVDVLQFSSRKTFYANR